jgi:hypothetical protein
VFGAPQIHFIQQQRNRNLNSLTLSQKLQQLSADRKPTSVRGKQNIA